MDVSKKLQDPKQLKIFFDYSDTEYAKSQLLWNVGEHLPNDTPHMPQEIDQ